jgi:DNA helicase HerA-like ATPase
MSGVVQAHRDLQRRLEAELASTATSVDGRRFDFSVPVHDLDVRLGGYVVIGEGEGRRLGQILDLHLDRIDSASVDLPSDAGLALTARVVLRAVRGEGVLLDGDSSPFADAPLRVAEPAEVCAWLDRVAPSRAGLPVGVLRFAGDERFRLDAGGFNRHTFLCGQSGSGKTYALGAVLEQLLLETDLRIVILDPNSDFVRLGSVRAGVEEATAERWRAVAGGIDVRGGGTGEGRLHLRFDELSRGTQSALLRLDPVADREEYAELSALLDDAQPGSLEDLLDKAGPHARALALRISNLGVDRWPVWSRGAPGSAIEALTDPSVRCLVLDLGSLGTRDEQALVADVVLETLWARRADRQPVLIVIDEAHNVCPGEPADALTARAAEHAVRIAAEGRKFGLYLLVSTQRPQKVQENVLSQCDNLVLMRMASAADLTHIGEALSFAPPDLLAGATAFRLGEALVAGKLASHPALIRFGRRVAEEGGGDVDASWARPRSPA